MRDISKSYGSLQVLKGISLEIQYRKVTSIVGPSGAGKTTLLQIMGTLDKPQAGIVEYDGTNVFSLSDNALSKFRNANIGFVFQTHRLLPEFSLLENVAMPALIAGLSMEKAKEKAIPLIKYMGLEGRLDHKPSELSGGESQRAAVVRALVNSPKVVLADEPSGSLDSANRRELHRLFFDLRDDMGVTFVIVTHDENLAADSDAIIHMRDGKIEKVRDNAPKSNF
ncbi:MAG: ABC transporter ATP-binding protein [Clostridium sp.]|nr:ABC transporter ATP-binding protein [Clostridium sp.]